MTVSAVFAVVLAACGDATSPTTLDLSSRSAMAPGGCGGTQSFGGGSQANTVFNRECCPYGAEGGECKPYDCHDGWVVRWTGRTSDTHARGLARVMAGAGMALIPGPNVSAVEREAMGEFAEMTIEGVTRNSSGRGRVDAVKIDDVNKIITVRELKPANSRAQSVGEAQLDGYIAAMKADGRVANPPSSRPDLNFKDLFEQGCSFQRDIRTYTPFD